MKAAIINAYGAPEVLHLAEVDKPAIKPDQVLVKVHASSVNPIDWKIRQGMLKLLTGNQFPLILGFDVAGEIVELGEACALSSGDRVTQFQVGDAIYARLDQLTGGAYAEYVAVAEKVAAPKPENMSYQEAAAVPLAALTALQALRDQGHLVAGQRVLINGASGGVGTFAIQIAKVLGAEEIVGVCSAQNAQLIKELGCDRAIDYHQQDFTRENVTYDIVFDVVGNRSFKDCKRVLHSQGYYVTTQPYPGNFVQSFLTTFLPGPKYKVILLQSRAEDLLFLKQQIEAGRIRAVIDRTYPLSQTAAAHTYGETERTVGKVVIAISE